MADPVVAPVAAPAPAAPVAAPAVVAPVVAPVADPAADPALGAPAASPAAVDPAADPAADPATDPAAVPAEVTYEFVMPEGVTLDEELGGMFKEFAKAKNLTNEEAQGLLDLSLKAQEKQAEAYRATQAEWVNQSKADKEFGGGQFDQNLAVANKALDAFGTPELKALLRTTGFGNHPEVIRAFVNVGKAVGEDKLVVRGTHTPQALNPDPIAKRMYPNMNP